MDEREELFKVTEKLLLKCREADFLTDDIINRLVDFILGELEGYENILKDCKRSMHDCDERQHIKRHAAALHIVNLTLPYKECEQ